MRISVSVIAFMLHCVCGEEVRLLNLDPPEAQQYIDKQDTSLKYAPKIESNVPAVRFLGNEPHNVVEDIYLANQYHGQDGLGGYLYGYAVPDIAKTEKKKAGGDLRGAYNYIAGNGQEIKVEYWDDGTGFHQVDNVPKILPKQIDDTPEVKAAKEEHQRIWNEQAERNSRPIENPFDSHFNYAQGSSPQAPAQQLVNQYQQQKQQFPNPGQNVHYQGDQSAQYQGQPSQNLNRYQPGGSGQYGGGQSGSGQGGGQFGSSSSGSGQYGGAQSGSGQYGGVQPGGGLGGSQFGSRPSGSGQLSGGSSGSGQYGGGAAGGAQFGSRPSGSGQLAGAQSGSGQYGAGQSGSGQYGGGGAGGGLGGAQFGSRPSGSGQYGSSQSSGGATSGQFGSGQSSSGGQFGASSGTGGGQYGAGQSTGSGQYGGSGSGQYGGSQPSAGGQFGAGSSTGAGQYGGSQPSAGGQYGAGSSTGAGQYGGSQSSSGGQYGAGQSSSAGHHGGSQSSGISGGQYGGSGQYGGKYSGSSSETSGQYSGDQSEGKWNEEEEEKGPPKGFFYSFDYPVGIIVQKGNALQKREGNLKDIYATNKANFEQQLQSGQGPAHGATGYLAV